MIANSLVTSGEVMAILVGQKLDCLGLPLQGSFCLLKELAVFNTEKQ